MNKAIVFFSGLIENYKVLREINPLDYDIFCADGGAFHAKQLNWIPKFILGDFDSIDKATYNFFKGKTKFLDYPEEKDFTDGELLIEQIYDNYEEIKIYGAFGGEHHHLLGNIFLLEKFHKLIFVNDSEEIFYVEKQINFKNKENINISFIPLDKKNKISLKGFKYNLNNQLIKRGDTTTLSNTILKPFANVEVHDGTFICVIQTDKKVLINS